MSTSDLPSVHISEIARHDTAMLLKARRFIARGFDAYLVEKTFTDGNLAGLTARYVYGGPNPPKVGVEVSCFHSSGYRFSAVSRIVMD